MGPGSRKIDINSASVSALIQLPQVGPALASEIIAARPYTRLAQLKLVSGVGAKLYIVLKDYLRVATDSAAPESHSSEKTLPSLPLSGKLDVNMASIQELQDVPGIGLVLAEAIVASRPYKRLPDLQAVNGVGKKFYVGLRKYLRVSTSHISPVISEKPRLKQSSKRKYSSSTDNVYEIPEMPSFEDDTSSMPSVSSNFDNKPDDFDSVEVDTVQELIGPSIIDGSQMNTDSKSSERVAADSVTIVNNRLRSNWQPVNIAIRPYRRRKRWRFIAAAAIAGIIMGVFQTYGLLGDFLGEVNLNPMELFAIDSDEEIYLENELEDELQVAGVPTTVGSTVVPSQIVTSQPKLTAMVVEPSSVIEATSESTQTVSKIEPIITTTEIVTIPTVTPIPSPTATQLPTPTKTIPIPENVRKIDPAIVPKAVLWKEEFEPLRFSDWGTEESKSFYSAIEDGVFRLITKSREVRFYSSAAPKLDMVERDYYYEGDVIVDNCAGNDFYGLVFKASLDVDEYFGATITCVGHYRLFRRIDGVTDYLRIAVSDVVPPGPGTYRLGILVKGNSFSLYVDGIQVYTQVSKGLGQVVSNEFGIYAESVESEEIRVSWDNLIATELER